MRNARYYLSRENYYRICTRHIEPEPYAIDTLSAAMQLRERGIAVSDHDLENMVRKGEVPRSDLPSRHPRWTPELIELVCELCDRRRQLTPLAAFLASQGLSMDCYYEAGERAYKAAIDAYGSTTLKVLGHLFTPVDYTLTICPARDPKKEWGEIEFSLRKDVARKIEKSKPRK